MANKRVAWLLLLAVLLIAIRIIVSLDDVGSPKTFFSQGDTDFELDAPESRKLAVLQAHPQLALNRSNPTDSSLGEKENYSQARNPFLFGKPAALPQIAQQEPLHVPIETVVEVKSELEQRFSGELLGMTELAQTGTRMVMLITAEDRLMLKEGELIDKRYKVKTIIREHIIIVDTQSGQELVLPYVQ